MVLYKIYFLCSLFLIIISLLVVILLPVGKISFLIKQFNNEDFPVEYPPKNGVLIFLSFSIKCSNILKSFYKSEKNSNSGQRLYKSFIIGLNLFNIFIDWVTLFSVKPLYISLIILFCSSISFLMFLGIISIVFSKFSVLFEYHYY